MDQINDIQFTIHEVDEETNEFRSSLSNVLYQMIGISFMFNPTNPMDTFFSIMENELLMSSSSNRYYPIDIFEDTIDESQREVELEKKDISINVSSQKFYTINTNYLSCSVCITDFKKDDMVSLLNECNHVFHTECIIEWGKYKQECPLCRSVLSVIK